MKVSLRSFWLPKNGNVLDEYEDAFWPVGFDTTDLPVLRMAVADGATETSFSGDWARLLTHAYCRDRLGADDLSPELSRVEKRWTRHLRKKQLPWYAQDKLLSGASAAFVGAQIGEQGRRWSAFAVGDCCLFQIRAKTLVTSFPLDSADLFSSRPVLLSTVPANNTSAFRAACRTHGIWLPGDTFYLMSDALAAWFLHYAHSDIGAAIGILEDIIDQSSFAAFVEGQRSAQILGKKIGLRNDDVTMLACKVT